MENSAGEWSAQTPYRVRLEWGRRGARTAAERGDILIVVDVLSFSTTVITALAQGVTLYPCATDDEARAIAERTRAEIAVHRRDVPAKGRFSLSPLSFLSAEKAANGANGAKIALPSPNGATCTRYGNTVPHLYIGAFLNVSAVAAMAACALSADENAAVTVLACGERWREPSEDGELRFALEDYLGAGAIIAGIPSSFSRSPEAAVAEAASRAVALDLESVLMTCGSGVELDARGSGDEVRHAARRDAYAIIPTLRDGERLEPA
jgi:2-phosphosulfolactate phosphatase